MTKRELKLIQEVSKDIQESEGQHLTPQIMPSFDPANRQDYINKMAEKALLGELTYYDIGRELHLTKNQIDFCRYFTAGDTMANGTKSAMLAYGYDFNNKMQLQSARNYSWQYMKPTHPCTTLIQIMINGEGLNAESLDMNLSYVAQQNFDLKAKVLAIREANTILGRNTKKTVEVTVNHKFDTSNMPKKERLKLIEILRKYQIKDDESD